LIEKRTKEIKTVKETPDPRYGRAVWGLLLPCGRGAEILRTRSPAESSNSEEFPSARPSRVSGRRFFQGRKGSLSIHQSSNFRGWSVD